MKSLILEVILVPDDKVLVVSNAAFMEEIILYDREKFNSVLNIGFLSNITKEKGIFEFIELVKYLVLHGINVKALVAGPVDAKIVDDFNRAIATLPQIQYVGPVYGEKKDDFFKKIDVLIFPTKNDAEPVTILEALGYGCIVIASNQGCIANQLCEDSGIIIDEYDKFSEHAYFFIEKIIKDKDLFEQKSAAAFRQFHKLRSVNRERLNRLSKKLMCG